MKLCREFFEFSTNFGMFCDFSEHGSPRVCACVLARTLFLRGCLSAEGRKLSRTLELARTLLPGGVNARASVREVCARCAVFAKSAGYAIFSG